MGRAGKRSIGVSLSAGQIKLLDRLAENFFGGNRSLAMSHGITQLKQDLYTDEPRGRSRNANHRKTKRC